MGNAHKAVTSPLIAVSHTILMDLAPSVARDSTHLIPTVIAIKSMGALENQVIPASLVELA
jgi:hypothetical protein